MLRRFLVAAIIGILAFLLVYFVLPLALSEADIVAAFSSFVLELSNRYFDPMPRLLIDYLALMNLLFVALTAALAVIPAVLALMIAWSLVAGTARLLTALLQREKKQPAPEDLADIDIDSRFLRNGPGNDVLGRGLDTIDRDRREPGATRP